MVKRLFISLTWAVKLEAQWHEQTWLHKLSNTKHNFYICIYMTQILFQKMQLHSIC